MRSQTKLWALATILSSTCAVSSATAWANVIGSELQNFNAAPSIEDGVTVSSARTLGAGRFSLGLFANQARNTLPYFDTTVGNNPDRDGKNTDTVTGLDAQIAVGLMDRWDLFLSIPSIVDQRIHDKEHYHGQFGRLGNTELRLGTKVQLIAAESFQLALQGNINYNRTDGNPYTGNIRWPGGSFEVVTSTQFGPVDWLLNVGHRWRYSEADQEIRIQLPIDPAGDQWLASTGVGIGLPATDLKIMAEIYGAYAEHVISDLSSRKNSIVEATLGIKKPLPYDLEFHAGVGREVSHSESSADFRVYAGLRWAFGSKTVKHEEVTVAPAPLVTEAPVSIVNRAPDRILTFDDVFFKFDSTEFREAKAQETLAQLQGALSEHPVERVIIEGYTCSIGGDEYNFDLSDRRAETIEQILIHDYHIAPEKLVTVGWGKTHAKYDNSQEVTRMNNRRVTFRIFYQKDSSGQNVAH